MKKEDKLKEIISKIELEEPSSDFNFKLMGKILNVQNYTYRPILDKKIFYIIGSLLLTFLVMIVAFAPQQNPKPNLISRIIDFMINKILNFELLQESTVILIALISIFILLIIDMLIHRNINKI
jgi:hypothetical protein